MVNSIGGASAASAAYATTPKTNTAPAAATATPAADEPGATPQAPAQSAESAAAARLGDALNAQADAARVQRAVDDTATDSEAVEDNGTAAQAPAAAAAAPPAGAAGGASASSETTDADYIAEADTNADKTVSDQERAAYEARLREQNEKQDEVRAAYGQDEGSAPALDVTA